MKTVCNQCSKFEYITSRTGTETKAKRQMLVKNFEDNTSAAINNMKEVDEEILNLNIVINKMRNSNIISKSIFLFVLSFRDFHIFFSSRVDEIEID